MKCKFSYIISVVLILLCWGVSASASERLFIEAQTFQPGKTSELTICLDNNTHYYGVQAEIVLPAGLSFVSTNGRADVRLSERLSGDYTLVSNIKDNTLRLAAFSTTHTSIVGNQGAILYVKVNANTNFTGGTVMLNNVLLTNKEDKDVAIPDSEASAEIPGTFTVSLDKSSLSMTEGDVETLVAQATKNGNVEVKSEQWSSSAPSVATVNNGVVTAIAKGEATITYLLIDNYDKEYRATCNITVEAAYIPASSVTIDKTSASLKVGETSKLTATVSPATTTDKTVTWTSSNPQVATVDNTGTINAISLGEATITAKCGDVSATCKVTVVATPASSVTLDKTQVSLKAGETSKLTATVSPETTTDKTVTWTSSNPQVATVDNTGTITAVSLGEATITATCGSVSTTCKVTVVATPATGVTLDKTQVSLKAGETSKLTATVNPDTTTDKTVTWTSSNPLVATVDNNGTVTAVSLGEATITAKCGSASATCKVTVVATPASSVTLDKTQVSLKAGETSKLTATVSPETTTDKTVTWTSSNPLVATVDNNGTITAVSLGEATITAKCGTATATCKVTVVATSATGVTLDKTQVSLKAGDTSKLTATVSPETTTDKTVNWTSSNPQVATVDNNGTVTAVSVGEATITAKCGSATATCKVTVIATPAASVILDKTQVSLKAGETSKLTATVSPEDATDKTVTWSSSNTQVATVDNTGTVTAVSVGEATITAKCGSATATCKVTVIATPAASVILDKTQVSLKAGETTKLTATVSPETTTDKTVTWTSSNPQVATVDNNGTVTAISVGEVTITAKCGSATATCKVTVVATPASGVTLDKTQVSLKTGETTKLTATVSPSDATDKTVTWTSSNTQVATVDNNGTVTAVSVGEATITAKCGSASATCIVKVVSHDTLVVNLNYKQATMEKDETLQLIATVSPETTTDKTVVWSSSNEEVAIVSVDGLVTAISVGNAIITATCGSASATCEVTVAPTLATSISLDIEEKNVFVGDEFRLEATVMPDEATNKEVLWSSSDESVATVDQEGNVKVVGDGVCVISASTTDGSDLKAECVVTATVGIADVLYDGKSNTIYTISGRLVRRNASAADVERLEEGIYIINGRKVYKRK